MDSEPDQRGERRAEVRYPAENESFDAGYKAPPAKGDDAPALRVLSRILSDGESSRLHQALVYERQIALDVSTSYRPGLEPGLFEVYVEMRPGEPAAAGVAAMDSVLKRLSSEGPAPRELEKAKNQIEADFVRGLKTNHGVGGQLGFYEHVYGDWRQMFGAMDRVRAVRAEDCRRVARAVFDARRRTVVTLVPEAEAGEGSEARP